MTPLKKTYGSTHPLVALLMLMFTFASALSIQGSRRGPPGRPPTSLDASCYLWLPGTCLGNGGAGLGAERGVAAAVQTLDEPGVSLLLSVINSKAGKDLWGQGVQHNLIFPKNSTSAFIFIER